MLSSRKRKKLWDYLLCSHLFSIEKVSVPGRREVPLTGEAHNPCQVQDDQKSWVAQLDWKVINFTGTPTPSPPPTTTPSLYQKGRKC